MSRELSLEVNKRCNFSCNFCYTEKYVEDLPPLDRVLELIEESISLGVDSISMTGGEPLLVLDRVVRIAAFSKAKGMRTRLNTNAYLLDQKARDQLIPLVDLFQVSFNADNNESFAAYTNVGVARKAFARVLNNTKAVKSRGGSVSIRFTLDGNTAPYLCSVFDLFAGGSSLFDGMVVDLFKVRVIVPAGDIEGAGALESDSIRSVLPAFFDKVRNTPSVPVTFKDGSGRIAAPCDVSNVKTPPCICGHDSIHISCDLRRATPCVFVRDDPRYALGELRSGDHSLASVWNSPALSGFKVPIESCAPAGTSVCTAHALLEKDKLRRTMEVANLHSIALHS
jgi:MoaA/NifB/PqqE/SkfB family radical SAM enzyme